MVNGRRAKIGVNVACGVGVVSVDSMFVGEQKCCLVVVRDGIARKFGTFFNIGGRQIIRIEPSQGLSFGLYCL